MNTIIVGSNAFFSGIYGFNPKDTDYLHIVPKSDVDNKYKYTMHVIHDNRCEIYLVLYSKQVLIDYALNKAPGISIGKYLVPEFAKLIDLNIDDLKQLRPMLDRLDEKHSYICTIFDAYISNDDFYLTDEQRDQAYAIYKQYRTGPSKAARPRGRLAPEAPE